MCVCVCVCVCQESVFVNLILIPFLRETQLGLEPSYCCRVDPGVDGKGLLVGLERERATGREKQTWVTDEFMDLSLSLSVNFCWCNETCQFEIK